MNHGPDITKRRQYTYRKLALLALALWAIYWTFAPSIAHAEHAAATNSLGQPKYGLDQILARAAPDLAARMRPGGAPQPVDTSLGYPNYKSRGPVAQSPVAAPRPISASATDSAPASPAKASAGNPLAIRQAAIETSFVAAATPSPAPAAVTSNAEELIAEADAIEQQLQRQELRDAQRAKKTSSPAIESPFTVETTTSRRLLASLHRSVSESPYRARARQQAMEVAAFVAAQRGRPAPIDNDLQPVAASAEIDAGAQVSRAMRGDIRQGAPMQLSTYQVFISDGYRNRHSAKSNENSSDDPGGVYHVGTGHQAVSTTTRNPFNNSAKPQ